MKSSEPYKTREIFRKIAGKTAHGVGHPASFVVALAIVIVWAMSGRLFHFSDTWQLVINTGTTIVTFLMVFLIQNTQNRDSHALHLKLDELIFANRRARNRMIALEELSEDELNQLQTEFDQMATKKEETKAPHRSGKGRDRRERPSGQMWPLRKNARARARRSRGGGHARR
jgi:low affinity Fe/Cu permease